MSLNNKYSDWLRIDLHIHTDWSKKTKDNDYKGQFSVTDLKQKLIQHDVQIFSLTDHNIINIDAYKEYYSAYNSATDPLLLVGVELDIVVNGAAGDKTYHSLLIFNHSDQSKAEGLHKSLEDLYTSKGIADKSRIITITEIVQLFPNEDFFFIPHAGNTKSIVDAYKPAKIPDAQRMVLFLQSALEKVPAQKIQIYNENFDKLKVETFQGKGDIAYIEFSDNHNAQQYPCTGKGDSGAQHEFYYVKGGKGFETLRLAFIDPESRIKSTQEFQQLSNLNNYLEKVKIEKDDLLQEGEITFSPHLNVLIGGRSSGKSLLLSILGDKIDNISVDRNKYQKVKYDNIKIKAKLDSGLIKETSFPKNDLIYIKQGAIVRYFEENVLEELAKESNVHDAYMVAKVAFAEHKRNLDDLIQNVITKYQTAHSRGIINKSILHDATISKILSANYIFKVDEAKLKEAVDGQSLKLIPIQKTVSEIVDRLTGLDDDSLEFSKDEQKILDEFTKLLKTKLELLSGKNIHCQTQLKFLTQSSEIIQAKNQLFSSESRLKLEANGSRDKLINDINDTFLALKELNTSSVALENFDYAIKNEIPITENINLVLEVPYDDDLNKLIAEGIGGTINDNSLYRNLVGLLRSEFKLKHFTDNRAESLKKKIAKQIEDLYSTLASPRDYLDYSNGSTSRNNSPGYNSEKYLEIILSNTQCKLVIIDQPEDNLGNRFIAERLVTILRAIKFNKQVILVTHNPSIVVYGDAENVIIAENHENVISYRQVVLENETYQKEICKILDGGDYIFNMRYRKYNIKKMLKTP